ncbi:MAG: hypothetical protein RL092_136 [Bacteroidota bacterium]|jgi:hypothetical protein
MTIMRRHVLFVLFLWSSTILSGQISEIKIDSLTTSEFPDLKGVLWARDPEGIDTSRVFFEENGEKIDVHFTGRRSLVGSAKSKRVIFMVTNGPDVIDLYFNQMILNKALEGGIVKNGDKVDVVGFNCTRRDGEVLIDFGGQFDFTDDVALLKDRVNSMNYVSRGSCVNCGNGLSEINYAVEEVLVALEKQTSNLPTAIIIVGDNNGQRRAAATVPPGMRARQLNVAIYGTAYPMPKASSVGSADQLAPETYGRFYKTDDANEAVANIVDAVESILPRSEGVYYDFKYKTSFEKDGMAHTIDIVYPLKNGDRFTIHSPELTFLEWIKKNVLISVLILVFFLLLVVVIILLIMQQKKMAAARRAENVRRMQELEDKQRLSKAEIDEDRKQIDQMRREQERKQQDADRSKREEQNKRDEERLIIKMKERGNFPWFQYFVDNKGGTWEMTKPVITVGRQDDCSWSIQNGTVSRKHFKITFNGSDYTLEDLGSSNGVVVNGRKVSRCSLQSADVIEFGNVRATFHI